MATSMISAFGMYVAVGLAWMDWDAEGVSLFGSGFGMCTTAILDGAGVAGMDAQLNNSSVQPIMTR